MNEQFIPLRVCTKWSKTLSATYVVYADIRSGDNKAFKDKFLDKVSTTWRDNYCYCRVISAASFRRIDREELQPKVSPEG